MAILHHIRQRSEEWDRLRLGIPTSSCFSRILTPGGKPSEQWERYACHLLAERLLGRRLETFSSPHMERGIDNEGDAAHWYELDRDVDTAEVGFITTDDGRVGCSPDRLVGNDGLLEIKVPSPAVQVKYLLSGTAGKEYKPQLQGQLWVAEKQWVDILAWHEELPRTVIRVERDEKYIATLSTHLAAFADYLDRIMEKIGAVAAPRQPLREALNASLQIVP